MDLKDLQNAYYRGRFEQWEGTPSATYEDPALAWVYEVGRQHGVDLLEILQLEGQLAQYEDNRVSVHNLIKCLNHWALKLEYFRYGFVEFWMAATCHGMLLTEAKHWQADHIAFYGWLMRNQ